MPKAPKKTKESSKKKFVFHSPKGMHDILPGDQPFWEKIRQLTKDIAESFNFLRIDTPMMEMAEIFERGIGEETEIVGKQMFFVKTKGERMVLRPEETAPVMRAYFEHGLSRLGHPAKLYYFAPMFRYEQPQAGRFRQFYQAGFEIIGGESDPIYDAETILVAHRFLQDAKIKNATIHINSIGCHKCRPAYVRKLESYFRKNQKKICKNCQGRLNVNPLRLLDCKDEDCQAIRSGAPVILDYLCENCKTHLKKVLEYLDELKLPYLIDSYLVRGLDYYNRTVFEIYAEGFNFALAGGGRYDYLAEMLKIGKATAMGASIGIERVIEVLKASGKTMPMKNPPRVFLIHIGEAAKKKSLVMIEEFRKNNIRVSESFGRESLKSQLRMADKEKTELALILGQKEVFEESIIIRDMKNSTQETVSLKKVMEEVKKRLK
ncbi:histidine--tRNA ligase [Candidatus Wolfebacteria bacterium]|nr:histidine--tRNA ligase [Candidatus Wolfebacteria bacterium]